MSEIRDTEIYTPNTSYLKEKTRRIYQDITLLEELGPNIGLKELEFTFEHMKEQTYAINQELNKLLTIAKQEVMNKARQPEAPYLGEDE